jgi:WD40 repeat protein
VNGQSGKIVTSYPAPSLASTSTGALSTTFTPPSTGKTYLATLLPLGGSPRFEGIAWSPDGKLIASTFSSASSAGIVQIWYPQTGQLAVTLAKEAGAGFDAVSWSPDGQYIAANKWIWTGTSYQVDVWSVKTHQIVFQQSGNQEFSGLSWQPGSHNLASALLIPGSNSSLPGPPTYPTAVLKIWNVTTKQLIKSFPGVNSISWSPNGKEFAYNDMVGGGATSSVTILDVNSGQKVYTYHVSASSKGQSVDLSTPSWSPDGKYIVTIEFRQTPPFQQSSPVPTQQPSAVVQVWVV